MPDWTLPCVMADADAGPARKSHQHASFCPTNTNCKFQCYDATTHLIVGFEKICFYSRLLTYTTRHPPIPWFQRRSLLYPTTTRNLPSVLLKTVNFKVNVKKSFCFFYNFHSCKLQSHTQPYPFMSLSPYLLPLIPLRKFHLKFFLLWFFSLSSNTGVNVPQYWRNMNRSLI